MKVYLRNKRGEFCTLGEWCAEGWDYYVPERGMAEAGTHLERDRQSLLHIRRMAEIIKAFDLPKACNITTSGQRLVVYSDGTWASAGYVTSPQDVVKTCERNWEINAALSRIWLSTEYEVED